ncbi:MULTISPECIES: hypothetical protein [unclassified Leucobacter]|uniref:hypothetical protein n=1 Tax=unclassified Leucobacter TaxID=2621730 RepID=UPI000620FB7B|nr:hypothetical protein [Leucobacter sp. Ag1]KKI20566.1 hypothetical protein XM48_07570 [Leucobacter sp. Ag1]
MATSRAPNLGAYVARVRGDYIDVDGQVGAQCWDLWSHYATQCLGVPSWATYTEAFGDGPHVWFACDVYHHARAGLTKWFEVLGPGAAPRPGDVAFWELGSAWYRDSHVAIVLDAPRPRMLRCLTQNPGAVQIADLITDGLLGYLRPRALTAGTVNSAKTKTLRASQKLTPEEDDMKPTVHRRTGPAPEWTRAHPDIGADLAPGAKRADGKVTVFRGYEVTTDVATGTAWARTHARGLGGETSSTDRAGYMAIQAQATRLSVALAGKDR